MSAIKTVALKVGNGGLVISPAFARHSATVILMHGLGDSADGLSDIALSWRQRFPHIKFILPTANQLAITINMGQSMNAWYNINTLDDRGADPCEGLDESAAFIHSLICSEMDLGLSRSRVLLAGFSQGGALSLYAGLQHMDKGNTKRSADGRVVPVEPLAGILALSAYLPKNHAFRLSEGFQSVPVLHCHGDADPVVRTMATGQSTVCTQCA
jgi:lysophospholipase-2